MDLEDVRLEISCELARFETFFTDPVKITCIVRNETRPNANLVITNDDEESVVKVLRGEGLD